MDLINSEGVSTPAILRKSREVHNLDLETASVNNQIDNLKEWIGDIKAKRIAVEAALDAQIRSKRQILAKRKRRAKELRQELDKLLVRIFIKGLIGSEHIKYISCSMNFYEFTNC